MGEAGAGSLCPGRAGDLWCRQRRIRGGRVPDRQKRRGPDLVGIIGLAVILGVLAGAYFLFPVLQRSMSYQDCLKDLDRPVGF